QVGRDRRLLDQERQRRRPAHELELIAPAELLLEREHVDRLAPVEEAEHDVVRRPVGLGVEIGGPQDLDDARERLAPFQQHGAERSRRYSRTLLTRSRAVTSWCSRIVTSVSPSVLIGSSSVTRRRSTWIVRCARKSTMSCAVSEPKSLPSSEA